MSNLLFETLPYLYSSSKEVENVQGAIDVERLILEGKLQDLYKQSFVNSSDKALHLWENMLGIKKLSAKYRSEDYQSRRENILARLRSTGVSSKKALEELCKSFSGGEVKIIEDNANYSFLVKFVSEESIPANLEGLTNAIEEVKPAHLSWSYILAYNIWLQVKDKTWELNGQTWGDDKTSDFIETDTAAICSNTTLCSATLMCGMSA